MRTPRLAGLGLATMATVALAVAGCADNTAATSTPSAAGSAAPTTTTSADPQAAAKLSQAVEQLDQTSFTLTASSGSGFRMTGSIDAPNGKAAAQLTASGPNAEINVKTTLIGQDLYAQVPGITKAGTWTHVDGSRLPANATIGLRPGQIDPVNTANLLKATTDVKATGDTSYAGSVDLSKVAGVAGLGQVSVGASGAPVQTTVPFTATLDAQGRLATLTVNLPQGEPLRVTYANYGQPVQVTAPAPNEITEAPDSFYSSLGS
ncbi:LppX_LprAFG lipoprotein [Actinoplanes subtropicus]|uniref:LppX_LprAFG lipoprotein n=1 Tax=Actinoplanes subtropicus TaxID=543632 RepID=UPI0004C36EAC|nr:LppX_LprAFG lipoprotein [Actinoplanes subtropicus]